MPSIVTLELGPPTPLTPYVEQAEETWKLVLLLDLAQCHEYGWQIAFLTAVLAEKMSPDIVRAHQQLLRETKDAGRGCSPDPHVQAFCNSHAVAVRLTSLHGEQQGTESAMTHVLRDWDLVCKDRHWNT